MKILTGWHRSVGDLHRVRDLRGTIIATIDKSSWRGYVYNIKFTEHYMHHCASLEHAMNACNDVLKQMGYEFVSEERAEKLRLLL